MLCSVGVDGSIMLWDLAASREAPFPLRQRSTRFAVPPLAPTARFWQPRILTGTVTVHDLVTHEFTRPLRALPPSPAGAACLAFAPDGMTLAIGQKDGQITLWDVEHGAKINRPCMVIPTSSSHWPSHPTVTLAFSSGDRSVRLWDVPAGQERFVFHGQPNTVAVLAFSPDGRLLVLGDQTSPTIRLWDITTGRERMALQGLAGNLVAMAISPDGATLAAADFHGLIDFLEPANSQNHSEAVETCRGLFSCLRPRRPYAGHRRLRRHHSSLGLAPVRHGLMPHGRLPHRPCPLRSARAVCYKCSSRHQSGANRPAASVQAAVSRGS